MATPPYQLLRPTDPDLGWTSFSIAFRRDSKTLHMLYPPNIPDEDLALVIMVLQREARRRLASYKTSKSGRLG